VIGAPTRAGVDVARPRHGNSVVFAATPEVAGNLLSPSS
jgi:hypothetical protein